MSRTWMSLRKARVLVVAVSLTLGVVVTDLTPGHAAAASGLSPASGVKKTVLDNGLTVLVKESTANDIVSVELLVGAGPKLESDSEAGISRLLQNSLLKGTSTRSAEQIVTEIESVGGRLSSGSTKEIGYVSLTCTREGLAAALDVFFDVVLNPSFPEAEVEKERGLILQGIRQRKDQLLGSTIDLAQEVLYADHPFHKPNEGYEETVSTFGRERVVDAYGRFYAPGNVVICAVGNLDGKRFVDEVSKRFKTSKGGRDRLRPSFEPLSLTESREKLTYKKSSSAWLVIAFPAPGISENDYLPARVLDSILGGSMHSRLFTELRDKQGLGYQVGSFFANFSRDAFVGTYIGTRPDQFEIARDGILAEIEKVRTQEVTDEELEDTKKYLRGSFIIGLESNESQAYDFAYYECLGLGYEFVDRYLEAIQTVTKADVLRVAKTYFGTHALASTLPEKADTQEAESE
jgi:zinc protease